MTNKHLKKIKLLFLPFLLSAILLIGGYTFLHWLLIIKLQLFSLKEIVLNFGIPFVLPAVPIFLILHPRLKLLRLKSKKKDTTNLYYFILWFAFAIPNIIAQEYVVKASGKLTVLGNVAEMVKHEPTKFYTVKQRFIDKSGIGVQTVFETSGKHNEDLNMHLYIAIPVLSDTVTDECFAWIGKEYSETVRNKLSDAEKDKRFKAFAEKSQQEFDQTDFSQFTYLDRMENSDELDELRTAATKSARYKDKKAPIFKAMHEPFANRNGDTLEWIFIALGIGLLVWLIMILIPKFNEEKLGQYESGKSMDSYQDIKGFFNFFVPAGPTFITTILLDLNLVVYIIMIIAGLGFIDFKAEDLLAWGANYGPSTKDGEWWRLLTNIFLHGGLMHLAGNMFGLVFAGLFLERVLGRGGFLMVYLLTGVIASAASLWWHDAVVSVGASGAIFGLYGIFIAFLLTKVFHESISKVFLTTALLFVGYNLVMGFAGNGIDNAAHIGGLISGFVIGLLLRLTLKNIPVQESDMMIKEEEQTDAGPGADFKQY